MKAVGTRTQILDGNDRAEIELAIEMREQLAIARGFPAQLLSQRVGIDADQKQPGLAEVMLSRGLRQLRGRGEMNVTVPVIVGAAAINALAFRLAPSRSRTDFVDDAQARDSCLSLSRL